MAASRGGPVVSSLGRFPALVAGDGPPLLLLAGLFPFTGVTRGRRLHEAALAPYAAARRAIYVNRRPGLPPGMTIAQLASELAAAMRTEFSGRPVDVLGMSTGGSIAQQLAADHPDAVRRLVLLATGARLSDETRVENRRIAARVRAGAPRRALAVTAAALLPGSRWALPAAVLAATLGPRELRADELADMATTIELEDGFDLAACAPIAAPTLVIDGDSDAFYPVALLRETAALIPGARLHLEPGRGHMTVGGAPSVQAAILAFLDDGPTDGGS